MLLRSLVIVLALCSGVSFASRRPLPVGVILSLDEQELEIAFRAGVNRANEDLLDYELVPIVKYISFDDSFIMEQIACELIADGTIAIFGPSSKTTNGIVSSICHNIGIPHLLFSWMDEEKEVVKMERTMTVNVYPDSTILSRAYADFVEDSNWRDFVVLYETNEGLLKLQDSLQTIKPQGNILIVIPIGEGPDYRPLLKRINETNQRNFLIDCAPEKMVEILKQAYDLKLLKEYQNYFLTHLDMHTVDFQQFARIEANITIAQLSNPESLIRRAIYDWSQTEEDQGRKYYIQPDKVKTNMLLLHDALLLFATSLKGEYSYKDIDPPNVDCNSREQWRGGKYLVEHMKLITRNNTLASEEEGFITGRMDLDAYGERNHFKLDISILYRETLNKFVTWTPDVGLIDLQSSHVIKLKMDEDIKNKTFIISAKIGAPFLVERTREENVVFEGNDRYEGYAIDLIQTLSEKLGFKYLFKLAPGGKNGEYRKELKKWNGIIGELIAGTADIGIGDLTITLERQQVVDFTVPFMALGISILYAKPVKEEPNYYSFFLPFSFEVWIYTAVVYLALSILLYAVARISNSEWESPQLFDDDPEEVENIWTISNAMWLTVGSIMGQGCDLMPKGVPMRLITGMWWFFALMMLNSYTANLSAFMTYSRMEVAIENVEDLAEQNKIRYGVLRGGSTQAFFKESNDSLYRKMWAAMENARPSVFVDSNDEGMDRVLKGKRTYAFLMESTMIEYVREQHCELTEVGSNFGDKFYGIALPLGSRYRTQISEEVLRMSERGEMYDLKMKWWKKGGAICVNDVTSDDGELTIEQVGGVFEVLYGGCLVAFVIGICEFLWNIQVVAANDGVTPWEALKSETTFALKFWIRHKPVKVASSSSSSSSSTRSRHSLKSKSKGRFSETRSVNIEGVLTSIVNFSMKSIHQQ